MPTSPDGIIEAAFDPERNLVTLVVHGEQWPFPMSAVTILRSTPTQAAIPVRGAEASPAAGGTLIWSDNEAPMEVVTRYRAQGHDAGGFLYSGYVDVPTVGAKWGVWVKVPGRPELTTCAEQIGSQDQSRQTLGGYWQIPGGPTLSQSGSGALAQSAGMGALTTDLVLRTFSPAELTALQRAVRQAPGQVVLIQTGLPEEVPSGYYQVQSMVTRNPSGMRSDLGSGAAIRDTTLSLVEAVMPAGPASGWSGTTYQDVYDAFDDYQDLVDIVPTYLDLATGGW